MRKTNKSEKNEWHSLGKVRGRACGGTFGGNNLLSWWQPSTAKGCHQSDRKRKKRWGVCIFLEEGNFGFCQALWVLADLFPTLSMIQIKHSFSWGKKKKAFASLFLLIHRSKHTPTNSFWKMANSLQPGLHGLKWFFCWAPLSLKSVLTWALCFNLQFNVTFSWQEGNSILTCWF